MYGIGLEYLSQSEQQCDILSLSRHIPILPTLMYLIIKCADKLQATVGDLNLKETTVSEDGLWMTTVCINAETLNFHHEDDCTYTLIHIPKQVKTKSHQQIFKLIIEENVSFVLKPSTSILFSRQHITHW